MSNEVNAQVDSVQQNVSKGGANNKKLIIIISAIAAVLLIVIVAIMMLFPSPKSVANKYLSGYKSMSSSKVLSTMHPKIKSELRDSVKEVFEEMKEENFKIKSVKLDTNYEKADQDELEYFAAMLESEYDIDEDSVKEIRVYEAIVKYSYDGETDEDELQVIVAKIGMKWYVVG